jgi:hypothetical protein
MMVNMSHKISTSVATSTVNYYPAVTVGSGNGWTIQSTAAYTVPSGFTFLGGSLAFDPSYLGSGLTLSSNNQVVSSATQNNAVLANVAIAPSTQVMFSMKLTNSNGIGDNINIGVAKRTTTLVSQLWNTAGVNNSGGGFYDDGRSIYLDTTAHEDFSTTYTKFQSANTVVDIAVDRINKKIWERVNGGGWNALNATPGVNNGDPATNSLGISLASVTDF